jgi:hypothetical protein
MLYRQPLILKDLIRIVCFVLLILPEISAQPLPPVKASDINKVYALLSRGNDLWIGTLAGLVKLDKAKDTWSSFTTQNSNIPDDRIMSLAFDSSGVLWVGTQYNAAAKFNGSTFAPVNSKNTGVYLDQYVTQIQVDSIGKVWLCADDNLFIFQDSTWKSYSTVRRPVGFSVTNKLVFDKTGTPWLGTDWGLSKFVGDTVLIEYNGFVNHVNSLAVDKNNALWVSEYGLVKYDGKTKVYYNTSNTSLPSNAMPDLKFDSKGNLWFPCGQNLVKFDGLNWSFYPCDFGIAGIFKLEIDDHDVIWLGALGNGLFKFDGVNWKHYSFLVTSVPRQEMDSNANDFMLLTNFPNPFNPSTTIRYRLPVQARVSIQIVNSLGQVVADLVEAVQGAGSYQVVWNSALSSGLYLCRFQAGGYAQTRKMLLLK